MSDFKFAIGDILVHRTCAEPPMYGGAVKLMVIERMMQECPGGIQRHYHCRSALNGTLSNNGSISFNEIELMAYSEYFTAYEAMRAKELAEACKNGS